MCVNSGLQNAAVSLGLVGSEVGDFWCIPLNALLCAESRWQGGDFAFPESKQMYGLCAPLSITGKESSGAEPCKPSWPQR